jgi:multidrug efflux pump subunit AcrB
MSAIFRFFIDNWKFSFLLTFMLILSGIMGLYLLQRESFPPVNFASVSVVTIYPGASPEEVQDRVTKIIEDELRGTSGLKDVKSTSQSGRSQINIRVDIDRDDSREIINEIQRAVTRAAAKLPIEVTEAPLVTEIKAKEIPVLELALEGTNQNRERDRMAENLKESLEDINGVSSIRLTGYQEREIQILIDRKKLAQNFLGLSDVVQKISARLKNVPAGSLEDENNLTPVRLIAKTSQVDEIEKIVLRTNDSGMSTYVRDIATVVNTAENPQILVRHNGIPATLLVVTKKEDFDAISVVDEALSVVSQFKAKLPPDQKIIIYNDEADRIKDRLNIVQFNAIAGLLAVLFVLFFFLPGKIGLVSSMSLPICALGTIATMVYLDANFNIITMIALVICLGNLVDNSVVISENYSSLREQGVDAQKAALDSANQFWIPFTASTITIAAAFLPMLVTEGVLGQFIRWIPIVVSLALTISLLESLTLLPARLQFLSTKKRIKKNLRKRNHRSFCGSKHVSQKSSNPS